MTLHAVANKAYRDLFEQYQRWTVIYKIGRSWYAESFVPEEQDFDYGCYFDPIRYDRIIAISRIDDKAIILADNDADFYGLNTLENGPMSIDALEDIIYSKRQFRQAQLTQFVECMLVPPTSDDE